MESNRIKLTFRLHLSNIVCMLARFFCSLLGDIGCLDDGKEALSAALTFLKKCLWRR